MKSKATDKTSDQCFLKDFKATCKNSGESELKPNSDPKCCLGRLCSHAERKTQKSMIIVIVSQVHVDGASAV